MRLLVQQLIRLTLWRQRSGQDLIEYALMAGFVATAAGAVMPGFANILSQIFSKAASVLTKANAS
jgi:pilus assembly protein Flp/PilA